MKNRNDDMLLRIAQADAYALAYEYVKDEDAPALKNDLLRFERYHQHPSYHKMLPGQYSDDTQMSIAVTDVLLELGTVASADDYMRAWFDCFKRDPRDSYSRAFQKILERSHSVEHLKLLLQPTSVANGAAMRAVPIGIIADPREVIRVADLQGSTTHAYGACWAAVTVALISHFALHTDRPFDELMQWGFPYCATFGLFSRPWEGPVKQSNPLGKNLGMGVITAWAVHTLLVESTSLLDIMRRTIEWGGDTDSVAAIAWGIASCRYCDEQLPEFLERDLEAQNGSCYGSEYLRELGKRLMHLYDV